MSLSSSEYVGFLSVQIILLVLGGLANLVVIAIVWKHKQLKSFTNYFLVNLAVADLLTLLFDTAVDRFADFSETTNDSQNLTNESRNCRQLPELEKMLPHVLWLSLLFKILSSLTLMCLAVGRYTALVKTFSSIKNILHRKSTIALLWGVSLLEIIIEYIFWVIESLENPESLKYLEISFAIFSVIVLVVIPTSVIVYCYGSIIKGIYFDKTILGERESNGTSDSLNKKILCRLTIVTVVSVLTTIPTVCFYIYIIVYDCILSDYMAKIIMSISTLDKIAATFNPVFYTLLNTSMRHATLKDLRHLKLLNN